MRIDHTTREAAGPPPPFQPPGNHQPAQGMQAAPNVDTIWGQDQDGAADEEYSPDSYTGEWPETRDSQTDDLDYPEDLEKSTRNFILYCGAEDHRLTSSSSPPSISPLPAHQWRPPPHRTTPPTNGCGAIIHTAAVPRKRCGVWMARFGSTDAVTEMDSRYFDRSVVVRMMKSPCGCVREGVGCRLWYVGSTIHCLSLTRMTLQWKPSGDALSTM